jgi:hypothetical protein
MKNTANSTLTTIEMVMAVPRFMIVCSGGL